VASTVELMETGAAKETLALPVMAGAAVELPMPYGTEDVAAAVGSALASPGPAVTVT
jgi:hypothetical protein